MIDAHPHVFGWIKIKQSVFCIHPGSGFNGWLNFHHITILFRPRCLVCSRCRIALGLSFHLNLPCLSWSEHIGQDTCISRGQHICILASNGSYSRSTNLNISILFHQLRVTAKLPFCVHVRES